MLICGDCGTDSLLMTVSGRRYDDRIQIRNTGKFFRPGTDDRSIFFVHVLCGGFLRIINCCDLSVNPCQCLQLGDVAGMDISKPAGSDDSELQHFVSPFFVIVLHIGNNHLVTRDTYYYNPFRNIVKRENGKNQERSERDCEVARLRGCEIARLRGCEVARLRDCAQRCLTRNF